MDFLLLSSTLWIISSLLTKIFLNFIGTTLKYPDLIHVEINKLLIFKLSCKRLHSYSPQILSLDEWWNIRIVSLISSSRKQCRPNSSSLSNMTMYLLSVSAAGVPLRKYHQLPLEWVCWLPAPRARFSCTPCRCLDYCLVCLASFCTLYKCKHGRLLFHNSVEHLVFAELAPLRCLTLQVPLVWFRLTTRPVRSSPLFDANQSCCVSGVFFSLFMYEYNSSWWLR